MLTRSISELQTGLNEIIEHLRPGDELVITRDDRPVARLLGPEPPKGVPVYGRGKGRMNLDMDDDSHLADFSEYMP